MALGGQRSMLRHFITLLKTIWAQDANFLTAVKDSPASIVESLICFFSVWSVIGLAGFHTYLATTEQTTNEDIKGTFTSKSGQGHFNPFSKGSLLKNCMGVLCGPTPPSLIDQRGFVVADIKPIPPLTYGLESTKVSPHQECYSTIHMAAHKTSNSLSSIVVMPSDMVPELVKKRDMVSFQAPDGSISSKVPHLNGTGKKNHVWDMTLNQLDYMGPRGKKYPDVHDGPTGFCDQHSGDLALVPATAFKDDRKAQYITGSQSAENEHFQSIVN